MDKKLLRAKIKKQSLELCDEYKKEASEKISALLLSSSVYKNATNIFIYISLENEPDTKTIIETAFKDKKTVYVPKCISDGIMLPVKIDRKTEMINGFKGLKEPKNAPLVSDNTSFDLCIIPCVSASRNGKRLGHGGGFYDRFLQKRKTHKVCLCFNELITPDIPTDEHDIPMDAVITEKEIISTNTSFITDL